MKLAVWSLALFIMVMLVMGPLSGLAWANTNAKVSSKLKVCPKRSLGLKDCRFTLADQNVHVWNDKIFVSNPVERDTKPLPVQITGEAEKQIVEWSFVRGRVLGGRSLLEIGIWSPPTTESDVESLVWSVYEIEHGQLVKRLERIIQKRKVIKSENNGKLENKENKENKKKYQYDKVAKYGLQLKNKKVVWRFQRDEGSF